MLRVHVMHSHCSDLPFNVKHAKWQSRLSDIKHYSSWKLVMLARLHQYKLHMFLYRVVIHKSHAYNFDFCKSLTVVQVTHNFTATCLSYVSHACVLSGLRCTYVWSDRIHVWIVHPLSTYDDPLPCVSL